MSTFLWRNTHLPKAYTMLGLVSLRNPAVAIDVLRQPKGYPDPKSPGTSEYVIFLLRCCPGLTNTTATQKFAAMIRLCEH